MKKKAWSPSAAREALRHELVAFGLATTPGPKEIHIRLAVAGLLLNEKGSIVAHDICARADAFSDWVWTKLGKDAVVRDDGTVEIVEVKHAREPLIVQGPTLATRLARQMNGKKNGAKR